MKHASQSIATAVLLGLAACSSREVVVVYSPHGPEILGDYEERFEAAYPEVDVQWLYLGSKQAYERVRAEGNRPAADVWWGAPASNFMQAADQGLLASYEPTWADAVPDKNHDPDHRWYGNYASPLGITYNVNGYSADDMPKSWDELLEPKWDQKITIREPLESGTMRTFIGATMLREGSDEAGLAWLKKLHAATEEYMPNPQQLFDHLKRNPELISIWLYPDIPLQRERNGFPLECVTLPNTPVIVEGIAIIEGAPHREWAEKFYEFVTTPEALAHQAEAYWKVPTRTDLDPETLPEWMRGADVQAQDIDWIAFSENEERWSTLWHDEVRTSE